ncbi:MAG: hypothetical protein SFZ02_16815 [bacterium]|nr:hypothetical protein [bacterium]
MMKVIFFLLIAIALAGCGGQSTTTPTSESTETVTSTDSGATQVVEQYLTLLVNKDETGFSQILCPAYEGYGMREFRSFGAVDASLNNVSCVEDGADGDTTLVLCTGTIDVVYQGEDTRGIDLSREVYRAVQEDGQWKVCGKGAGE